MPARFVIDRDDIIHAAESDPDYTTRPEPGDTLTALRALVQGADLGLAPSVGDCGTATAGCDF